MKRAIFVCGMNGGKRDQFLIQKILKNFEIIYFPYNTKLIQSFESISKELELFIKNLNLKKNEKISLIGVSAGGIIIDYYLKFLNSENNIDKIAIICSPFKGTYLPKIFAKKSKGVQEIFYSSEFIKKLNSKKLENIKIITFYSYFDLLIPGKSGKYLNSQHTFFFLHWIVHFWPPIIYKIKNFFEKN